MKNVALEGRWECSCFSCFLRPFPPFAEKGCSHYTTYDIYPFPNPPYLIAIIITVIYLFVFRFLSLPHPETLKIQVSHADAVLQIKTNQNQNPSKHNPTRITQALIFNDVHVHATHTLGPYIPPPSLHLNAVSWRHPNQAKIFILLPAHPEPIHHNYTIQHLHLPPYPCLCVLDRPFRLPSSPFSFQASRTSSRITHAYIHHPFIHPSIHPSEPPEPPEPSIVLFYLVLTNTTPNHASLNFLPIPGHSLSSFLPLLALFVDFVYRHQYVIHWHVGIPSHIRFVKRGNKPREGGGRRRRK